MKADLDKFRITILAGIGLLCVLLAFMGSNLLSQMRGLSIAQEDNTKWSISQLDTEFANLSATLSNQLVDGTQSDSDIRLRLDIALSRLSVLQSGKTATLFRADASAQTLIAQINAYALQAIEISEAPGPLTDDSLQALRDLTEAVRPDIRKIALLGVDLSATLTEERRTQILRQLSVTSGMALALLVLIAVLMVLLDRMTHRAIKRDAELRASTELLKTTISASLNAIVAADHTGRIIEFNTAAERTFGWKREEVLGFSMEQTIIPERLREAHRIGIDRFQNTGERTVVDKGRLEMVALRKNGDEFPVELNVTSVEGDDGTKFIGYMRDISNLKINEQKLIDARDRAERTDRAKSQFLTVMSHEMRTPLNGILGVLDLMKATKQTPEQARYTDIASASGEILLEHINEALDITRIEAGTLELMPQDFDLPELLTGVVEVLEPLATQKGLFLTMEIAPTVERAFHGDSGRLRQILINLIGNAIKFTQTGGVHLTANGIHSPDGSSLRFAVRDTGAGIADIHKEQIFEDFLALSYNGGQQARGGGLGLSTSRKIARQMGGDITVTSEPGSGSTFTMTAAMRPAENISKPAEKTDTARSGLKILIVEDNKINRKVLSSMLQGLGHTVSQAENGLDCLEIAEAEPFDLIFMDISMPVMDGLEATSKLRAGGGPNAGTHIVGLTAHGREEYQETSQQAGMSSFHSKPIRMAALRGILDEFERTIPEASHPTAAMSGALQDLISVLGPEKVSTIGSSFFEELSEFIDDVRAGKYHDATLLAEGAHKMKGAAALLGQRQLETPLLELEKMSRARKITDLYQHIDALEKVAETGRNSFEAAFPDPSA